MSRIQLRPAVAHLAAVAVGVAGTTLFAPRTVAYLLNTVLYTLVLAVFVISATLVAIFIAAARANKHTPPTLFTSLQAHATRPLSFATPQEWPTTVSQIEHVAERIPPSDPVAARLDSILGLVRKSFILPWYARISPSPAFPSALDSVILHALGELTAQMQGVDWPNVLVARMLPILTAHFEHFRSVEHLASPMSPNAVPLPLPKHAHRVLASRHGSADTDTPAVEAHLRVHVDRVVALLLPEKDRTEVVQVMVREVVLGAILMPVFQMLCDPDFWNRQINEQGAKYMHEKNQINKVLSALSSTEAQSKAAPIITIHSTIKQFDDFMRSIPKLKSLGDARRLRSDVERELRSARSNSVHGGDRERAARRVQRYIHRLERARGQIDRRIAALSGSQVPVTSVPSPVARRRVSLYAIIADPSCLAYWLEYMERRGRSHLVQFWLTVEGFKDPLEVTGNDLETRSETLGDDIAFLHSAYFTTEHKIDIPSALLETISDLAGREGNLQGEDVNRAKRAVEDAQKAVYLQMEENDWPAFQKSELYFKALAEMKDSGARVRNDRIVSYSPPRSPTVVLPPPLPMRSTSDYLPRRPHLVNGSFAPTAATPAAAATSTALMPEILRRVSGDVPTVPSSSSSTPPPLHRSVHLDALFAEDEASERDPLFADTVEDDEAERMEAIQSALQDIIAEDGQRQKGQTPEPEMDDAEPELHDGEVDPLSFSVPALPSRTERHPLAGNKLTSRSADDLQAEKDKYDDSPIRKVSQYDVVSRRPLRRGSSDGTLIRPTKSIFDDSVDEADEQADDEALSPEVLRAIPGDLHLAADISEFDSRIAHLVRQESILSSLVRQAELTGNQKELRLLERSLASLQRERRTAEFQVAQFRQQEEENRLVPGRTSVCIPSAAVSDDHQIVRYTVEISQVHDGRAIVSWTVAHRYSEFWDLDRALRDSGDPRIIAALRVELPGKSLVPSMSSSFVESRRAGLERYLETLVASPLLCENSHVRNFFSRSPTPVPAPAGLAPHKLVKSLYKTVASSYESSGPSMIDIMTQSLTRQLAEVAGDLVPALRSFQPPKKQVKGKENDTGLSALPPTLQPLEGEASGFTAPICDLFIEVFDLKENWVRRQAIVIILQQILGGTIERKLRDSVRAATEGSAMERLLTLFQDSLWPGGERREATPPPTHDEIHDTRVAASRRMAMLIPDVAANMMGRGNARRAAAMLWASVQDARLNRHLVLCLIDEVFTALKV